ncbi:site-2 protease family protein [Streptomyces sp. NPDC050121]|uniref:site-2 protease family protein n=1 Tax=Streptomyces sp. NPDC050121 TaxID=3365601 RepID=UPI0037952C75
MTCPPGGTADRHREARPFAAHAARDSGLFALGTWLLALVSVPRLLVEVVGWLAGINLLLAVFNALPAAPLDGGRLLRAFLWWRTGDRLRATAGATAAGRVLGWLLIVLGLVVFMRGGGFGGLWLALIGWFLIAAATAEGPPCVTP